MTRDAFILRRIREILGASVEQDTDATLLRAYACWHMYGKQDWSSFGAFISVGNRVMIYDGYQRGVWGR